MRQGHIAVSLEAGKVQVENAVRSRFFVLLLVVTCCVLAGCGDGVQSPSAEELRDFEMAAMTGPVIDMDRMMRARIQVGPYRVVPGDILTLQISRVFDPQSPGGAVSADGREEFDCRVNDDGTIILPIVGALSVAGRSLAEIESAIIDAYYPKYIATKFPVYVSVRDYRTHPVQVAGAVARMGIYNLRHDQMSLMSVLMEAGGIVDSGAAVIRIVRQNGPATGVAPGGVSPASTATHPTPEPRTSTSILPLATEESVSMPLVHDASARVLFKPEGRLATTGWLTLGQDDEVLLSRWLDLGSDSQRGALLAEAETRLNRSATVGLEEKLVRLAAALEDGPDALDAEQAPADYGWERTETGRFVTVVRGDATGDGGNAAQGQDEVIVLPVKGLNIPAVNVALEPGDSVFVERPATQYLVVLGLVRTPGIFPHPPDAQYNLIEALGLAGGLDPVADPRYVSLYRLTAAGEIVSTTLQLVNPKKKEDLTEALALPLKPGDIVYVEHTPRTRTNVFFDRIFRISLGLYFSPDDLWGSNG